MNNSFLSPTTIESLLTSAPYEPALGIRLKQLSTTQVRDQTFVLIAIKLDKGKQLIPHFHEHDGEILFPLTTGTLTLGSPKKDGHGYEENSEKKVLVDWEKPQQLTPGKPVSILPAIAHHIAAPKDSDCMVLFFLPQTHLSTDRTFVVYPDSLG